MPPKKKARADELLHQSGLAASTKEAASLIMSGAVMATDLQGRERRVDKPGAPLDLGVRFRVRGKGHGFASRGGQKLQGGLDAFSIDVAGLVCADIGISTGGFTDCLLQRGAQRVHGVDVGYGQVAWHIRQNERVKLYERTNARNLPPNAFGEVIDLAVIDVSFISLRSVLPAVVPQLRCGGTIVALVKPQFEAPREAVVGGVVRDEGMRRQIVDEICAFAESLGLAVGGVTESPIKGPDGNVELLVRLDLRTDDVP